MNGAPRSLIAAAVALCTLVVVPACASPRSDVAGRFQSATCSVLVPLSVVEADDQRGVDIATLHRDYRAARLALISSARALASRSWPGELQRNVTVVERDDLEQARQFEALEHRLWEGPGDVPGPSLSSRSALVTIRALLGLTGAEPCGA